MNIVGVAPAGVFPPFFFNNIAGVASFFNCLFLLRPRRCSELNVFLSYTYIFWDFSGPRHKYLLFLLHRRLPRFVKALERFHRFEALGGSHRRRHVLTRHFGANVLGRQAVMHALGAPHPPKRLAHLLDQMAFQTPAGLQVLRQGLHHLPESPHPHENFELRVFSLRKLGTVEVTSASGVDLAEALAALKSCSCRLGNRGLLSRGIGLP